MSSALGGRMVEARRTAAATAAALVGFAAALGAGSSWEVALLVAWLAAAAVYLVAVWATVVRLDPAATRRLAQSEDASRTAAEALLLSASVASLVAVGFGLALAGREHGGPRAALTVVAVASVVLGWLVVHTVFLLRYGRLYYTDPIGGLGFEDGDPPSYRDFAYVALTIGMTYQVSDTEISKRGIRRAAIHHALLSYLFGAVILGITVSTVASLLH